MEAEENGYERVCRNISGRDLGGPTDSWVSMKPIGDFGKPFYIVTADYFKEMMLWFEDFGRGYAAAKIREAREAKDKIISILNDLDEEIKTKERAVLLQPTKGLAAPTTSVVDPNALL